MLLVSSMLMYPYPKTVCDSARNSARVFDCNDSRFFSRKPAYIGNLPFRCQTLRHSYIWLFFPSNQDLIYAINQGE